MTAYVLVVCLWNGFSISSSFLFPLFFFFFYFCRNCTAAREESDTTIPILRQQGYKLIRYTLYGYHDSPFSFSMYCLFLLEKIGSLISGIIRSFNYTQRCYSYMQIAITLRQGEIRTFIFYLSEMKQPNWCFWAGNLLILFT